MSNIAPIRSVAYTQSPGVTQAIYRNASFACLLCQHIHTPHISLRTIVVTQHDHLHTLHLHLLSLLPASQQLGLQYITVCKALSTLDFPLVTTRILPEHIPARSQTLPHTQLAAQTPILSPV